LETWTFSLLAEVKKIDFVARTLETTASPIPYDYLILAAGSITHFFGVEGASRNAFTLKTLDDGIRLRNHILCSFERAARIADAVERRRRLTFAIVGGGPTGVEYAGALAELFRGPLKRDFSGLDPHDAHVVLLEGADRLLASMSARLGQYALRRLQRMGVEVRLESVVDRVEAAEIHLRDGSTIAIETTIWTAGVRGEPAASPWGLPLDRSGRAIVEPTLEVRGLPSVYAIGDVAHLEEQGRPLPMVAPGRHAARGGGGEEYPAGRERRRTPCFQLPRPWDDGHHRPECRGCADWPLGIYRFSRVDGMDGSPLNQPDRVSQPAGRPDQLGLGLFSVRTGGTFDSARIFLSRAVITTR
jgi:NADH dehydrogenase